MRARRVILDWKLILFPSIIAMLLTLVGIHHFILIQSMASAKEQLNYINAAIDKVQDSLEKERALTGEVDKLQEQLKIEEGLLSKSSPFLVNGLYEMANICPDGVWFEDLQFSYGDFNINILGYAGEYSDLIEFNRALVGSKAFDEICITYVQAITLEDIEVLEFHANLQIVLDLEAVRNR